MRGGHKLMQLIRLSILLGLLLTACVPAPLAAPTPAASPTPVRTLIHVVNLPFIAFAPFYIGIEEGLFAEQGIDVDLVNMSTQPDTLPALVAGQVDVVSGQVSASMFNFVARGGDAKLVADKGYIDPNGCDNIALVARKSLALPSTGTADALRGKKIHVVPGSWNDYLADKVLQPLGLTTGDMDIITLPSSASDLPAMDSGQLDLAVDNEPFLTQVTAAGHVSILQPPHVAMPGSESAVMIYGPKLMGANAEIGNRFMMAYLKGVREYNQGKTDRNVDILAQYTKLDPAILRQMCWPALRDDGALNVDSVLDFQTWAVQKGLVQVAVSKDQLVDTSFATTANQRLAAR
jgi:NitT/TauT family transport system substrate-binding protein